MIVRGCSPGPASSTTFAGTTTGLEVLCRGSHLLFILRYEDNRFHLSEQRAGTTGGGRTDAAAEEGTEHGNQHHETSHQQRRTGQTMLTIIYEAMNNDPYFCKIKV